MTRRKKVQSKFKLVLRRLGLLCKRSKPQTRRIRITKTINPDGSETHHDRLTDQPLYIGSTFETELHIWKEIHRDVKKKNPKK